MMRRLLTGLALTALLMTPAAPTAAHSDLVSSDPADGAVLSAPPASVSLTFSEDLLADVNVISINREDGTSVSVQEIEPQGPTVRAIWPAELTAGSFQVAYRVVSGDGHPVDGAITLTITGEATTSAPSAQPVASPMPVAADNGGSSGESSNVGLLAGVAGIAVLALAIVLLVRRRRG